MSAEFFILGAHFFQLIHFRAELAGHPNGLSTLEDVHDLKIEGNRVRFDVETHSLDKALRQLTDVGVRSLTSQPPTLEELFLRHYTAEVRR